MSVTVLHLHRYRRTLAAPLFIFVDLQQQSLRSASPSDAIDNCRSLLSFARGNQFSVAHVRLTDQMISISEPECGDEWIDDCKPYGSEMIFDRLFPSCYSNTDFVRMMDRGGGRAAILAGFGGASSCLATLIDAQRKAHNIQYVFDASYSPALPTMNEQEVHAAATQISSQFANLVRTADVLKHFSETLRKPAAAHGGLIEEHGGASDDAC